MCGRSPVSRGGGIGNGPSLPSRTDETPVRLAGGPRAGAGVRPAGAAAGRRGARGRGTAAGGEVRLREGRLRGAGREEARDRRPVGVRTGADGRIVPSRSVVPEAAGRRYREAGEPGTAPPPEPDGRGTGAVRGGLAPGRRSAGGSRGGASGSTGAGEGGCGELRPRAGRLRGAGRSTTVPLPGGQRARERRRSRGRLGDSGGDSRDDSRDDRASGRGVPAAAAGGRGTPAP